MRKTKITGALMLALLPTQIWALDWDWGEAKVTWNNRLSVGVAVRMQDRSNDLIGKLNIPGQQFICGDGDPNTVNDGENCLSVFGDPEPNLRLVRAAGAFSGVNADDGNLNYDKGDVVAATNKLISDFKIEYGNYIFRTRALGFYDPQNVDFTETHVDTRFQPSTTKRPGSVEGVFAKDVQLYEANVSYAFEDMFGLSGAFSVGNQIVRWGESTLVALNSLAEINPPNAAILRMPGFEINELFQPVPVALLSMDLFEGVSTEIVYQFGWKKVQPDPRGSFFADSDLIGGQFATITLGANGEDPGSIQRVDNVIGQISSTSLTTALLDPKEPEDGGQYGIKLSYFAEWLNGGTELGFYFFNYHSRLPYATVFAADDSCARDSTSAADAIDDCNGFNGPSSESLALLDPTPGPAREPLPIDSFKAYLDYPEDIHMFGISFNTNIPGGFSLAGEFSYRPNVPMQIHLTDVIFTGLQPAFPAEPIEPTTPPGTPCPPPELDPALAALCQLGQATLPSAAQGVPSYLMGYRGISRVQANSLIKGYERMKVGQFDFTAIKAFSSNPFGADQILSISEIGGTMVFDMPSLDQLQFEGGGVNRTHYSEGADGTSAGRGPPGNSCGEGAPTTCHFTPTSQNGGFADSFAWGLRQIIRWEYNDVIFGWGFKPILIAQWDVEGIAPYPLQNFVEGRKEISAGTDVTLTESLSARLMYQWFTGGGRENTRMDRDNLAFNFAYNF